jgi:hypothetical protein
MAAYTTIDDPELYFNTKLFTGNASADNAITGVGFQPDWVWLKDRVGTNNHSLYDSVRGVTKAIRTSTSGVETTTSGVTTFGADGFTVGDNAMGNAANAMVAWCWKETATAGFDIVSYTGNGTDDTDISHNLSAVPKMIIIKNRDAADSWQVKLLLQVFLHLVMVLR